MKRHMRVDIKGLPRDGSYQPVLDVISEAEGLSLNKSPHAIRWMAQTFHQAHHSDIYKTFMECPTSVCEAARIELRKAQ